MSNRVVEGKKSQRNLSCVLLRHEVEERSARMALLQAEELPKVRANAKAAADAAKGTVSDLEADISQLARQVYTRREVRAVDCVERWDYERGVVEVVRTDTGEIVEDTTRMMTTNERQQPLPGFEEAVEAAINPAPGVELVSIGEHKLGKKRQPKSGGDATA